MLSKSIFKSLSTATSFIKVNKDNEYIVSYFKSVYSVNIENEMR